MDLFTMRCSCGSIVRLPSLKARGYSTRCAECLAIGRVRAEKTRPERMAAVPAVAKLKIDPSRCDHNIDRALDRCVLCGSSGHELRRARDAVHEGKWSKIRKDCAHALDMEHLRCTDCGMSWGAALAQARRRAKTPLEQARCNVSELFYQQLIAQRDEPQAVAGVRECLIAAREELAREERGGAFKAPYPPGLACHVR